MQRRAYESAVAVARVSARPLRVRRAGFARRRIGGNTVSPLGTYGWQLAPVGGRNGAYVLKVVGEDRTQGAFLSGVRVGDRIYLRDYNPSDRWDLTTAPLAGHTVLLHVLRDGHERSILAKPTLNPWTWDQWALTVALFWMLIFAAFVA